VSALEDRRRQREVAKIAGTIGASIVLLERNVSQMHGEHGRGLTQYMQTVSLGPGIEYLETMRMTRLGMPSFVQSCRGGQT
jgi:hypothetical protein